MRIFFILVGVISSQVVPAAWQQNYRYIPTWIAEARAHKKTHADAPMTFINTIGTCWLISAVQLLLTLPRIRDIMDSSPDQKFKSAMLNIWEARKRNVAVYRLETLRATLSNHYKNQPSHNSAVTFEYLLGGMPLSKKFIRIVNLRQQMNTYGYNSGLLAQLMRRTVADKPILVFILESRIYSLSPLEIQLGRKKRYRMVGALRAVQMQGMAHVIAHVRLGNSSRWYALDNHYARVMNAANVKSGFTDAVAYALMK